MTWFMTAELHVTMATKQSNCFDITDYSKKLMVKKRSIQLSILFFFLMLVFELLNSYKAPPPPLKNRQRPNEKCTPCKPRFTVYTLGPIKVKAHYINKCGQWLLQINCEFSHSKRVKQINMQCKVTTKSICSLI